MFVRVFRDLLFQICVSADSFPSACKHVSKLDIHTYTSRCLRFFHDGRCVIVHTIDSFTIGPHLL